MSSRLIKAQTAGARIRRVIRNTLLGATTLAMTTVLVAGAGLAPAAADEPLTVAEAKVQVERLEVEAEAIDQEAVGVKEKLTAGRSLLAMKQEDVRQQTAKVARIRKQVGQVALAQFQNRNLDTTAQLFFNSDTDGFLNKMATVEKVSENQNTILQDYQASQARLADLERSAKVDVADLQGQDKELSRLRAASAAKITESKAVLSRLTEEERARIAAEEAAARAAAEKAAEEAAAEERAKAASAAVPSGSPSTASSSSSSAPNGKGATAVAFARAQLGKPYSFGAAGPQHTTAPA